mmetsp:Transcript_113087/g.314778  ORF Transcript_113087/g.314778 Transcript_113087/m.314778 type:complete len:266 (-) Transcript_113087:337-1134(-)
MWWGSSVHNLIFRVALRTHDHGAQSSSACGLCNEGFQRRFVQASSSTQWTGAWARNSARRNWASWGSVTPCTSAAYCASWQGSSEPQPMPGKRRGGSPPHLTSCHRRCRCLRTHPAKAWTPLILKAVPGTLCRQAGLSADAGCRGHGQLILHLACRRRGHGNEPSSPGSSNATSPPSKVPRRHGIPRSWAVGLPALAGRPPPRRGAVRGGSSGQITVSRRARRRCGFSRRPPAMEATTSPWQRPPRLTRRTSWCCPPTWSAQGLP